MLLYLVRHGETIENASGILMGHMDGTLSKKGIDQVKKVAEELKEERFDHVYSSDLRRCVDTVKEIMKYHNDTKVEYTENLRESYFGEYQGMHKDDVPRNKVTREFETGKEKNIETLKQTGIRVSKFIDWLKSQSYERVLIVAHTGVIGQIIAKAKDVSVVEVFSTTDIQNAKVIKVEI